MTQSIDQQEELFLIGMGFALAAFMRIIHQRLPALGYIEALDLCFDLLCFQMEGRNKDIVSALVVSSKGVIALCPDAASAFDALDYSLEHPQTRASLVGMVNAKAANSDFD